MTPPARGQFTLHARVQAPLTAGDYTLTGTQAVNGGAATPYQGKLRIDAPRFTMPPDQILSTFPPANAEGAFEDRLPQIVLKRRTLPWDRRAAADAAEGTPWLALVVVAENEAQLSGETPVADCVTPGINLPGPGDVPTSVYLGVTKTVVDKVFPTQDDVTLLAHVRQVDPSDTELSLGDDDGFLAVVMANRLPQFHRAEGQDDTDHPVRYLACLISIEGQLHNLPPPPPDPDPIFTFEVVTAVQDLSLLVRSVDPDHYVMGTTGLLQQQLGVRGITRGSQDVTGPARPLGASATSKTASAASWQHIPDAVADLAISSRAEEVGRVVRDAMGAGWRYDLDQIVLEPTYRFPVLAHWSFTVTGSGSFETLMRGLDVGLLGTAPAVAEAKPDEPPPPPPTRPEAELTDTGHVGLPHLTRRGDAARAWYRGPLTPRATGADPDDLTVRLPLAHASDQLRRITPDGREDVSLAAAFEIGRLLALSSPAVVAAQLRWRREQFGASRVHQFGKTVLDGLDRFGLHVSPDLPAFDLGRLIGRDVVLAAATNPEAVLAPARPLVDPGRPLDLDGDLDEIIATGFGIPLDGIRRVALQVGMLAALQQTQAPGSDVDVPRFDERAADQLRAGLDDAVNRLAADVLKNQRGPVGLRADEPEEPDVLDELIAAASRNEEVRP